MAEAKKIRRLKISNDNYHRRNNTFIDDDTLPFPIHLNHKNRKKTQWKKRGMKIDDDDFDYVYNEYIHTTNCDLCNKVFLKSLDRQLDHCHNTGEVRNIVCNKCNHHKEDIIKNTNTGEIFIYKVRKIILLNFYKKLTYLLTEFCLTVMV